jgi:aminopeptidase N
MQRIMRFILVPLLLCGVPAGAVAHGLIDQELFVQLIPAEHSLQGKAVITLADRSGGWPESFVLAAGAVIDQVETDGRPVPFRFENGRLQVSLQDGISALTITYRVRFEDPVPQETVGIEDPSYGVTATILPQGTFLSASAGWHPLPVGMKSRFRVTISGPPGVTGVTDGRLVAHMTSTAESQTVWQTQLPRDALTMAAGNYQVHREDLGGTQILTFMTAGNAALAAGYLESCRAYLQLYQQLFGPYPYSKFAVVENFYPTGYGLPGWTLLGSSVVRLPFIRTSSLPHEIAHAWWGNAVQVDYGGGNWAEGLATYVADYYLQELQAPDEALEYRRKILRDYAALVDDGNDRPLTAFRSRMTKSDQAIGYGKAAMVFHMLRVLIGDDAFWTGLQHAASEGLGKRYAWSDLQRHFETASARNLDAFFRQWTERPGAPQLRLEEVRVQAVAAGWRVTGVIAQAEPPYELVIPLHLETVAGNHRQTLDLAGRQASFTFTVTERPVSLTVDPDNALFRALYPEEIPATVNHLRASRQKLVVVAKDSEMLFEASRDLLRGLQWHQAPVMSEAEYLVQQPTGSDLLVLGWPQGSALRPVLPAGFNVSARHFRIGERSFATPEDVLFMVVDSHEDQHVAGYFLPGSVAAAQDTARRIPHYGRYSYLVFSRGSNLVKATWGPDSSPLKLFFEKDSLP